MEMIHCRGKKQDFFFVANIAWTHDPIGEHMSNYKGIH